VRKLDQEQPLLQKRWLSVVALLSIVQSVRGSPSNCKQYPAKVLNAITVRRREYPVALE
jgi:hypothetical protein